MLPRNFYLWFPKTLYWSDTKGYGMLVSLVSTWHNLWLVILEEWTWTEKKVSIRLACGWGGRYFLGWWLEWESPAYCGQCRPWTWGIWQSLALLHGFCFRLPPWLSSMDCDLISKIPFHPMVFIIAEETQIRQVGHKSET